jgi:hypothetical protein
MEQFYDIINVSGFVVASLLSVVGKSFVDFVKKPLQGRGYDTWWAGYLAVVFGVFMVLLSGANMFNGEYLSGYAGLIITGLYAGGVSIGIYQVENNLTTGGQEEPTESNV